MNTDKSVRELQIVHDITFGHSNIIKQNAMQKLLDEVQKIKIKDEFIDNAVRILSKYTENKSIVTTVISPMVNELRAALNEDKLSSDKFVEQITLARKEGFTPEDISQLLKSILIIVVDVGPGNQAGCFWGFARGGTSATEKLLKILNDIDSGKIKNLEKYQSSPNSDRYIHNLCSAIIDCLLAEIYKSPEYFLKASILFGSTHDIITQCFIIKLTKENIIKEMKKAQEFCIEKGERLDFEIKNAEIEKKAKAILGEVATAVYTRFDPAKLCKAFDEYYNTVTISIDLLYSKQQYDSALSIFFGQLYVLINKKDLNLSSKKAITNILNKYITKFVEFILTKYEREETKLALKSWLGKQNNNYFFEEKIKGNYNRQEKQEKERNMETDENLSKKWRDFINKFSLKVPPTTRRKSPYEEARYNTSQSQSGNTSHTHTNKPRFGYTQPQAQSDNLLKDPQTVLMLKEVNSKSEFFSKIKEWVYVQIKLNWVEALKSNDLFLLVKPNITKREGDVIRINIPKTINQNNYRFLNGNLPNFIKIQQDEEILVLEKSKKKRFKSCQIIKSEQFSRIQLGYGQVQGVKLDELHSLSHKNQEIMINKELPQFVVLYRESKAYVLKNVGNSTFEILHIEDNIISESDIIFSVKDKGNNKYDVLIRKYSNFEVDETEDFEVVRNMEVTARKIFDDFWDQATDPGKLKRSWKLNAQNFHADRFSDSYMRKLANLIFGTLNGKMDIGSFIPSNSKEEPGRVSRDNSCIAVFDSLINMDIVEEKIRIIRE